MSWLESKLQVAYKIEGAGPREEIWEIPLTVFKEAIINALSHRDYYEQGASIMIEMFDDRETFRSEDSHSLWLKISDIKV